MQVSNLGVSKFSLKHSRWKLRALVQVLYAAFKTKVDKCIHGQTHKTQEKPYKCPDGSEAFATNKKHKVHMKVHRSLKMVKFHVCGMNFSQGYSLHRHFSVHTGAKLYSCSVCQPEHRGEALQVSVLRSILQLQRELEESHPLLSHGDSWTEKWQRWWCSG